MASPRNIRLLGWFNFFVDFRFYAPVAVIYFAQVSGSYSLAAMVLAAVMISGALFEIPTGVYSDRIGRKQTMLLGAAATALAVTIYAFGNTFWLMLVGAIVEGLGRALYSGNNQAMLYESLDDEGLADRYPHHSGRIRAMFQASAAIGAIGGSLVVGLWSLKGAFIISIVPQLLCIWVSTRLQEPKRHIGEQTNGWRQFTAALRSSWSNPALRRLMTPAALTYGAGEASFQFQGAFVASLWPAWGVGLCRGLSNGFACIGNWTSGRAIEQFGLTKTLFVGQVLARSLSLVALVRPTIASPALITGESLAYGSSSVALDALRQNEFSSAERATIASVAAFLNSVVLAVLLGSLGVIADHYGPAKALLAAEILMAAMLPLFWRVHRSHRHVTQTWSRK